MGPVLFSALVHLPTFCRQGLLYVILYVMIQFLLRRMDLKDIITGVVNQLRFFSYLINSFQHLVIKLVLCTWKVLGAVKDNKREEKERERQRDRQRETIWKTDIWSLLIIQEITFEGCEEKGRVFGLSINQSCVQCFFPER